MFKIKTLKGRLVSLPFLLGVLASTGQAQTQIFQVEAKTPPPSSQTLAGPPGSPAAPVSAVASPSQNSNAQLFVMLEQLQQEVRELRGLTEEQAFQIEQLQQRGKDRYRDLDTRLLTVTGQMADIVEGKSLSAATTVANEALREEPAQPKPIDNSPDAIKPSKPATAEQKAAYQAAYSLIKQKQFDDAIDKLLDYIDLYPEGDLTGNAYYWLGEVYLVIPDEEKAAQAFKVVINGFPAHRKVPDALYKLGIALERSGQATESVSYLDRVLAEFPQSTAARLAKKHKENQ